MKTIRIVLLTLLFTLPIFAFAKAFWTGRQVQVKTVTGRSAWKCEYSYGNQKFWRVYEMSCPSSIDVY